MSVTILQVEPVIQPSIQGLCARPYRNHPKGCPNFGRKEGCPPNARLFDEVFDISKPVYAIVNRFDFKEHVDRMKKRHPAWSEYQARCCLYWQSKARSQLLGGIRQFLKEHKGYKVNTCPEAMGINVTETLRQKGITIEWPPENFAYQVALAGIEADQNFRVHIELLSY